MSTQLRSTYLTLIIFAAISFCPLVDQAHAISPWVSSDAYGYTGHNLNSPLWHQIATPTTLSLNDDSARQANIPFTFYFYGLAYNSVYVSSNGLLCFSQSYSNYDNTYIPNLDAPNAFVAPFWDDLIPGTFIQCGLAMNSPNPGQRKFVVTYQNAHFYSDATANITFQVVLNEGTNQINFTYLGLPANSRGTGGGATIGIESQVIPVQYGILYSFDEPGKLQSGYMLTFCPPPGCPPLTPTATPTPVGTGTNTPTPQIPPLLNVDIQSIDDRGFPLNTLIVKVTDGSNQPILGLNETHFRLSEQPIYASSPTPQAIITPVRNVGEQGLPLSVALVVDVSGSMSGSYIEDAKRAIINFANNIRCLDQVALISFESSVHTLVPFTMDRYEIENAVKHLVASGSTAMYDGIMRGLQLAQAVPSGAKAVIVFTDGDDNASSNSKASCINFAQTNTIPIYTIGLGASSSVTDLRDIANRTGGDYYDAPSATDLEQIYNDITLGIKNQYLLQYFASDPTPSAFRRTVQVCVQNKCDSIDYTPTDPCILDQNELFPGGAETSDSARVVAQRFTCPKWVHLEEIHIYHEYVGASVAQTSIWSHDPVNNRPASMLGTSPDIKRITCDGWFYYDYTQVVPMIQLLLGEEYWIVVHNVSGAPTRVRYSNFAGWPSSTGGSIVGVKDASGFINWQTADMNRDLFFRALSCNVATPPHTPTSSPTMTPSATPTHWDSPTMTPTYTPVPTSTPTLTPTGNPTSTPTLTMTPTFTPSRTPSMTPTMTMTNTPSSTPTPTSTPTSTPTPDIVPPYIRMAGWGNTNIDSYTGGNLELYAWVYTDVNDLDTVELYANGQPTGILLNETAPGSSVFYFSSPIGSGVPPGKYYLELLAKDTHGNKSDLWPYFNIRPGAPPVPAPSIPNWEEDMELFLSGASIVQHRTTRQAGLPDDPNIFVGGYNLSDVYEGTGGTTNLICIVQDRNGDVPASGGGDLMYFGQSVGIPLSDDGLSGDFAAGDTIYGMELPLSGPLPATNLLLEVEARDLMGNSSCPWPYFCVPSATPTMTPTYTPTVTPTATPTNTPGPQACYVFVGLSQPWRVPKGDWVYTDATCSTDPLGQGLEYFFDWGDGDDTGWQDAPYSQHRYFNRGTFRVTCAIRDAANIRDDTYYDLQVY